MDPISLAYRSPLYRYLRDIDAEFAEVNGYAVAISTCDPEAQFAAARRLAICDLSGLPRVGVKGPGIGQWLAAEEWTVPSESNRALRQRDGSLLAMLAHSEGLALGDIEQRSGRVEQLDAALRGASGSPGAPIRSVVPRQHSQIWLRITGDEMPKTMAKVCAVDLRPGHFENLRVAQTSVARLNAIVIRDDLADIPAIHLLADSASAEYLWQCMLDAGEEHGVSVVGLGALRQPNWG